MIAAPLLSLLIWLTVNPSAINLQKGEIDADVKQLVEWMVGEFTSQEHTKQDPSYLEVHVRVVSIWPQREDGPWLYFEQAMATAPDKPYRQRVYQVSKRDDGAIVLKSFALPGDPLRFAGVWRHPRPLNDLPFEKLIERKGCEMILKKQPDGSYHGGTEGKGCPGELRGAAYSISELSVSSDTLKTWQRGLDSEDKLVWGNSKGPYVLKKNKEPRKPKGK
jgi:CpeT protein